MDTFGTCYPPFDDSHLTAMLHDALGGNCLTFALLCLAPNDFLGSKATLQLGKKLPQVDTFPLVNNDMIQGLLTRQALKLASFKAAMSAQTNSSVNQSSSAAAYERKLHELEGKVAQETLEKRLLREDKEKLISLMNELKTKYNELFDNELDVRKELLACEQEKLALSKAFVQFEIEKNAKVQELDSDRFEIETKLIQAEQMVLEIQQDDAKKASQIQDLIAKMNELVREKTVLSEELALLQKHAQQSEQQTAKEAKKNQQLSLELLVAVNQKQKAQQQLEGFESRSRQLAAQLEENSSKAELLRLESADSKDKLAAMSSQVEQLRREVVLKDLEAEKLRFHSRNSQIDLESEAVKLNREYEAKLKKLTSQLETAAFAAASERKAFELQLERLALDLAKCQREKEELVHSWMAKLQENEELLVANERLILESEAQLEAHRLKIAFLASSSLSLRDSTVDLASEATAGGGVISGGDSSLPLLRELIASYQSHEKQLRSQLAQLRSKVFRLEKRLRARVVVVDFKASGSSDSSAGGDQSLGSSNLVPGVSGDPSEDVAGDEKSHVVLLMQELSVAQAQSALEKENHASCVLRLVDIEKHNQSLILERDALRLKLEQNRDEEGKQHVDAIRAMHEALLTQLEEVRVRLTQQQESSEQEIKQQSLANVAKRLVQHQHQASAATANRVDTVTTANAASNNSLELLEEEKRRLEARLAASTRQWTALVEQVERRCAELLTKNVMLAQENSDLRAHFKVRNQQLTASHTSSAHNEPC